VAFIKEKKKKERPNSADFGGGGTNYPLYPALGKKGKTWYAEMKGKRSRFVKGKDAKGKKKISKSSRITQKAGDIEEGG